MLPNTFIKTLKVENAPTLILTVYEDILDKNAQRSIIIRLGEREREREREREGGREREREEREKEKGMRERNIWVPFRRFYIPKN